MPASPAPAHASVHVAFHLDGAWSVHCPGGVDDGAPDEGEAIVGWTSV